MNHKAYRVGAAVVGGLAALSLSTPALSQAFVPVSTGVLENPSDRDWLHMSRTYNQHHFSPLTQINQSNVGQLRMVWSSGLGDGGTRQQSTPLVYNGVMYAWLPGDRIRALNAANGDILWEHVPEYDAGSARSKAMGIYQDMIYWNTLDGFIRALNAETGEVVWETAMTGRSGSRNSAGGVLVADGKVLMNGACTAFNPDDPDVTGRNGCYIVALDAMTGEEAWKFYTAPADGDPAAASWPAHIPEEQRNASPWGVPGSYDPDLRMTFWGTADPKPYPHLTRYATEIGLHDGVAREAVAPADLYSNSTLAIDIASGDLQWYFQGLPADNWDADHNQERMLINTMFTPDANYIKWINPNTATGVERKIVLYNAEGGGQYALDRATGEFLWARPFPHDLDNLNMNFVNVQTGQTSINFDLVYKKDGDLSYGCFHNTRNWWVQAYSPLTNSQYIHYDEFCLTMQADATQGRGYGLRSGGYRPDVAPEARSNMAKIDISTGEIRVLQQSAIPAASATLVTAGGLVFTGDILGYYQALDHETGAVLWETRVGGIISQSNITYEAGGKQYVMIFTGGRGGTGAPRTHRAETQASGRGSHHAIYVFALP